jgi:hypothetical protein
VLAGSPGYMVSRQQLSLARCCRLLLALRGAHALQLVLQAQHDENTAGSLRG